MHCSNFLITKLLISTLVLLSQVTAQTYTAPACYRPNGLPDDSDYRPCGNMGLPGMCCATNRAGRDDQNICTPDGLCIEAGTADKPGKNTLWREGCTDPTWRDPRCLKLCVSGSTRNLLNDTELTDERTTHVVITTCSDGSYCCGQNNTACCDAGEGVWVYSGTAYSDRAGKNPILMSASLNISTSLRFTTAPTSTSTLTPSPLEHGMFDGLIASIVAPIIGGLAAIFLGVWCCVRKSREAREPTVTKAVIRRPPHMLPRAGDPPLISKRTAGAAPPYKASVHVTMVNEVPDDRDAPPAYEATV